MSGTLFEPITIAGLELKNRFVRSATCDHTADETGAVTDRSLALYRNLGQGGVGLVVSGFAFVSPDGQALPGQYSICTDEMIHGLRRMVDAAHEGGAKIAVQIVHAGANSRYLSAEGIEMAAMSHLPDLDSPHRVMTDREIDDIIDYFTRAAVRGREAGFDAVQLHGAHGYLMSQALSHRYNRRTDRWGGTPEKRRTFHVEVIRRVKQAVGVDFPLFIKFGVMEDEDGGLTLSEGIETAQQMVKAGLDAIEISASDFQHAVPRAPSDGSEYTPFRERAAAVKQAVSVPVILVGGIRCLETAEDITAKGDADMVAMCRPFIREPGLIARWQQGDRTKAKCISCGHCRVILHGVESIQCGEEHRLHEEDNRTN